MSGSFCHLYQYLTPAGGDMKEGDMEGDKRSSIAEWKNIGFQKGLLSFLPELLDRLPQELPEALEGTTSQLR